MKRLQIVENIEIIIIIVNPLGGSTFTFARTNETNKQTKKQTNV